MPPQLRVFVSSTMNDLANERAAVVRKLREYYVEPVNAEAFAPGGSDSWATISEEIGSSHVMILILGERYGWIPDSGPHASEGRSVTELEYLAARDAGIPVLPFFSRLAYGADSSSADARNRDRFRDEVANWDGGLFRQHFDLAEDLAEMVGRAIAGLLAQRFFARHALPRPVVLPYVAAGTQEDLAAFLHGRPTIFAGAGVSLAEGLPSAHLMIEAMLASMHEVDQDYVVPASGTPFNVLATDLAIVRGREHLEQLAQGLIRPAGFQGRSDFHRWAASSSDMIITTNYDDLFERVSDGRHIIASELGENEVLPTPALVKLHGTIDEPASLVLTEADQFDFMNRRPRLTANVIALLSTRPVLVIGSSLRDPSIRALFSQADRSGGMFVAPTISQAERRRVGALGLRPIEVPWAQILETFRANAT